MKIVVIARTLNEELNISRFCQCYANADRILIADGGSIDRTIEIAAQYRNVRIRHFGMRTHYEGGVFFNPEAVHVNSLIDWAVQEEGVDWLISDDVDCIPSAALHDGMRSMILGSKGNAVCAYRLHIYGEGDYFPMMSLPGQSLWAWKPAELPEVKADERTPETQFCFVGIPPKHISGRRDLFPPFVLLHYFAPTEAERQRKMERYAARGTPQMPLKESQYWPPEPLPAWGIPPQLDADVGLIAQ